jgi:hypothetical protein
MMLQASDRLWRFSNTSLPNQYASGANAPWMNLATPPVPARTKQSLSLWNFTSESA